MRQASNVIPVFDRGRTCNNLLQIRSRRSFHVLSPLVRNGFFWWKSSCKIFTALRTDEDPVKQRRRASLRLRSGVVFNLRRPSALPFSHLRELSVPANLIERHHHLPNLLRGSTDSSEPAPSNEAPLISPGIFHRRTLYVLRIALILSGFSHEQLSGTVTLQPHPILKLPPMTDSTAFTNVSGVEHLAPTTKISSLAKFRSFPVWRADRDIFERVAGFHRQAHPPPSSPLAARAASPSDFQPDDSFHGLRFLLFRATPYLSWPTTEALGTSETSAAREKKLGRTGWGLS